MNYNKSQQTAIRHKDGPMLVLAGPGSGKTAVITRRTQYLIQEGRVDPGSILVITFTRAAAQQMRRRFERQVGEQTRVSFGTFHAVFFTILKAAYHYDNSNIITPEQKFRFLREILSHYQLEYQDEKQFINDLLGEISYVKNARIPLENYYSASCGEDIFRKIYEAYGRRMRQNRLIDYDDMLVYTYELFLERKDILSAWQRKYRYILIDEFQDINRIQYEIIRMLALPENNLFIVGDDDQSIYRFRGSAPEIMLHFPQDYPQAKTVLLDVNYRCGQYIEEVAANLISHNKSRFAKKVRARSESREPVIYAAFDTRRAECQFIRQQLTEQGVNPDDCAVLYRTNTQAGLLCELLAEQNIPFSVRDGAVNIFDHWIARDILTYLAIAHGSRARADFLQIMNRPNRYLSRDSLQDTQVSFPRWMSFYFSQDWMVERIEKLKADLIMIGRLSPYSAINYIRKGVGYEDYLTEYALERGIEKESLWDVLDEIQMSAAGYKSYEAWLTHISEHTARMKLIAQAKEKNREGVTLATLHSAKGLEFDTVFLLDVNEGVMPYKKAIAEKEIEEERRLFYVGLTRARRKLVICSLKGAQDKKMQPSRFLEETRKAASDKEQRSLQKSQSMESNSSISCHSSKASNTASYSSSSRILSRDGIPFSSSK